MGIIFQTDFLRVNCLNFFHLTHLHMLGYHTSSLNETFSYLIPERLCPVLKSHCLHLLCHCQGQRNHKTAQRSQWATLFSVAHRKSFIKQLRSSPVKTEPNTSSPLLLFFQKSSSFLFGNFPALYIPHLLPNLYILSIPPPTHPYPAPKHTPPLLVFFFFF